jgi:hypothetical protein
MQGCARLCNFCSLLQSFARFFQPGPSITRVHVHGWKLQFDAKRANVYRIPLSHARIQRFSIGTRARGGWHRPHPRCPRPPPPENTYPMLPLISPTPRFKTLKHRHPETNTPATRRTMQTDLAKGKPSEPRLPRHGTGGPGQAPETFQMRELGRVGRSPDRDVVSLLRGTGAPALNP